MGNGCIGISKDFWCYRGIGQMKGGLEKFKAIDAFISMAFMAAKIADGGYIRNEKGKPCKLSELSVLCAKGPGELNEVVELLKRYGFINEDEGGIRIGKKVLGTLIRI